VTRVQRTTWSFGLVASVGVLMGFAFTKGGPDWYLPVFLISCAYCVLGGLAAVYVRRTRRDLSNRDGWVEALATSRLGLVGIAAMCVVLLILLLFRSRL
jgi:hypothetical protein